MSIHGTLLQSSDSHDGSVEWMTPKEVFDPLHKEFGFQLDACASPGMERVPRFFSPAQDGLQQSWASQADVIWCNPPYGRQLKNWVQKCYEESCKGATVVMLIFAVTDTKFWHEYCMKAREIRLVEGRIRFVNPDGRQGPATKSSAIVVFDGEQWGGPEFSSWRFK